MVSVVPVTYKDCFAVVVVVVDIVVDITIPMIPKWIEPCMALAYGPYDLERNGYQSWMVCQFPFIDPK